MAMLCLFHRSSMCRPGHCALMRSELLDLTTIISATACHQSNYVEPYSRYNESAGKQRSGKTRKGNQVLRAGLTQLAHGAVRTKGTYVSALYRRLAARRGKRRAILAVAHSIMVSVFHMLSRNEPYRELGATYFDERRRHYTVDRLTSRIEHLGYRVHLEPLPTAAA